MGTFKQLCEGDPDVDNTKTEDAMKLLSFPELRQIFTFDCGACAGCCVLAYYGVDVREEWFMKFAGTTKKNGTYVAGMVKAIEYFGLTTTHGENMTIPQIRAGIDHGYPAILSIQAYHELMVPYADDWDDGHFVVAIGYNKNHIYFEDPASYTRTWLSNKELEERWHDTDEKNKKIHNWACIVKGKPRYRRNESAHMD